METFLIDIVVNFLGNVVTWLVLGLVTMYIISHKTQASFREFFGLEKKKKMVVYLSNLWDPSRTSGHEPWGSILAGKEFQAVKSISKLFGTSPFSLPEMVRGFVDTFWIGKQIELTFEVSPMDDEFDRINNLIVLGATTKNRVRRNYAKDKALHVIIEGEPLGDDQIDIHSNPLSNNFKILQGHFEGEPLKHEGQFELAIIEKRRERERVVFFCIGTTAAGSRAAAEYLAINWQRLWQEQGNRSFALCLWFQQKDVSNPPSDGIEPFDSKYVH